MFTELFPIVQEAETVILRLQIDKLDPTRLQVFVSPQHVKGEKYPALNQTIMLSNTPAALDQEFSTTYRAYAPEYVAASTSIKDAVSQLAANTEAAKKAATKAPGKNDGAKTTGATPKLLPKPAPTPSPQVNLFDDVAKVDESVGVAVVDGEPFEEHGDTGSSTTSHELLSSPECDAQRSILEPDPVEAPAIPAAVAPAAIPACPPAESPPAVAPSPAPAAAPISLFETI